MNFLVHQTNSIKSNQIKSNQIKSNQIKSMEELNLKKQDMLFKLEDVN